MDKKSKIFLWVFFLLIIASVGVTYWRIMIKKDYIIEAQADCDPTMERCFVQHCDEAAGECTGKDEEDTTYFKKISRVAANIPLCDPADEDCKALECPEGEKDCTITLCDEAAKGEEDECNDPESYNAEHLATNEESDSSDATCDPEMDDTCSTDQDLDSSDSVADASEDNSNFKDVSN